MTDVNYLSPETLFLQETFQGLQAQSQNIEQVTFRKCRFEQCDFSESQFSRSRFFDCVFEQCNLSMADLTDCSITGAQFKECRLLGINWSTAGLLKKLSFHDCTLNYGTFLGLDLPKTVFENCLCHNVYFTESNFSESRFTGSDLQEAMFAKADLRKADFRKAKNYLISPTVNKLAGAKFAMPEALALLYSLEIELED